MDNTNPLYVIKRFPMTWQSLALINEFDPDCEGESCYHDIDEVLGEGSCYSNIAGYQYIISQSTHEWAETIAEKRRSLHEDFTQD